MFIILERRSRKKYVVRIALISLLGPDATPAKKLKRFVISQDDAPRAFEHGHLVRLGVGRPSENNVFPKIWNNKLSGLRGLLTHCMGGVFSAHISLDRSDLAVSLEVSGRLGVSFPSYGWAPS